VRLARPEPLQPPIWPKYTPCGTIDTGVAAEDAAYD